MQPIEISASGLVTGLGWTAPASCAAIRAGITRNQETNFVLGYEPLIGVPVEMSPPLSGREKLLQMSVLAVGECLEELEPELRATVPVILCLPEEGRPGQSEAMDGRFLFELRYCLGLEANLLTRALVPLGRVSGAQGLIEADALLQAGHEACVIVGVDSLLTLETLVAYHDLGRLKTESNADGFIPGEAVAAVLVRRPKASTASLQCLSVGTGLEPAPLGSGEPLRAEGLSRAVRHALDEAHLQPKDLDFRIADLSGEQYGFKEASLAMTRVMRAPKQRFETWHPAECVGEVGAAIIPLMLAVALAARRRGYAAGARLLCHASSDGPERAAVVLQAA